MNTEEAEQKVKEILNKDGIQDYKITTNVHTEATNIRTIEAESDQYVISLILENETGEILDKRMGKNLVREINETVPVSDSVSVTTIIYFGLTEPTQFPGLKVDSENIKIIYQEKKLDTILGFEVRLSAPSNDLVGDAHQEIRRLTNLMSLKLGRYVTHRRPENFIVRDGKKTMTKSFTADAVLVKSFELDLNDEKIKSLMKNDDPILNQQLADTVIGIKSYDDTNFRDAIRNFWQVVESENLSFTKNYKSLRDGLSHSEINSPDTINDLKKDFGLNLKEKSDSTKTPKGVYIDTNDPKNREILKEEATFLRIEVIKLVESKLPQ